MRILLDEFGTQTSTKIKRDSDECLEKIWDQNTQGLRRSMSQTESEQNCFSEQKTSWLFFPVSSFCHLFMDLPPCLVQTTYESTCVSFFKAIRTQNKIAESRAKFHKFCYRIALVFTKFLKNSLKIIFCWNPCKNLHWIWDKARQISGQTDEYSPRKKIKLFHTWTDLPFSPGSDE